MTITAEQVRAAVMAKELTWIDHHNCSLCDVMVGYCVHEGRIFFASGCGCSWSPPRESSWQDAADWINMQSKEEVRRTLAVRFGIEESA